MTEHTPDQPDPRPTPTPPRWADIADQVRGTNPATTQQRTEWATQLRHIARTAPRPPQAPKRYQR